MNIDQTALCKWITAGLQIPEVNQLHGDGRWLLSNMIAKFTLAADVYLLSVGALAFLKDHGVNMHEVHARSRFYGKKSPLIYEHAIPATLIRNELLNVEPTEKNVSEILQQAGSVAAVLRTEDSLLNEHGLASSMPEGWQLGHNPLARYSTVGIQLSDQVLRVRGKICR